MTIIDQRILIPAAPDAVWDYIANLDNNPQWQVDCDTLVFLSQRRTGPGTRWRQRAQSRQEHVYEIATWYNGLGYEYTFIDGAPFKSVKGRIRLQEIPEGTIVQWTFDYELTGGVLGGIRNALTTQRKIENDMAESLKMLWKQARRMGGMENYVARSLMQDGVQDPTERANYTPRRTNPIRETLTATSLEALAAEEPPINDEDTRPSSPAAEAPAPAKPETPAAPSAEDQRFAPPANVTAPTPSTPPEPEPVTTEPPPVTPEPPAATEPPPAVDEPPAATPDPPVTPKPEPAATEPPPVTPEPPVATSEPPVTPEPPTPPLPKPESVSEDEPAASAEAKPQVAPGTDTSEMSIWEVFGIPSPTDTQRMRAIKAAEEAEREYEAEEADKAFYSATQTAIITRPGDEAAPTAIMPTEAHTPSQSVPAPRTGLRVQERRNRVRLRRPGG